ncbi:MAG TPA: lipoyl(octanoyl) transferase LipB [Thiotrichales bacterium]|nr:lipoyl(octanoyl) transferase LipB [Thiotrichales bacterium]
MVCRFYDQLEYEPTWRAMQAFTHERDETTPDELWFLQHPPVYTLGKNGKPAHVLDAGDIPVINIDRGGQVTYHGPGQLVVYTLLDLKRLKLGIREMVSLLEDSVIDLLAQYRIKAESRRDAPGVYVNNAKIAALGLRVRKGCCFHGLALNVAMELEPFSRINPCGFENLPVTQVSDLVETVNFQQLRTQLQQQLLNRLKNRQ